MTFTIFVVSLYWPLIISLLVVFVCSDLRIIFVINVYSRHNFLINNVGKCCVNLQITNVIETAFFFLWNMTTVKFIIRTFVFLRIFFSFAFYFFFCYCGSGHWSIAWLCAWVCHLILVVCPFAIKVGFTKGH